MACDLVVNRIIHNERDLSENPRLVLIPGIWVEGQKPQISQPGNEAIRFSPPSHRPERRAPGESP